MAIAPQDNDAFLREVDENLRRDQLLAFGQRWGRLIAAAIGLFLILLAAGLWWRNHRQAQAGIEGETLSVAIGQLQSGNAAAAGASLRSLAGSPHKGYRAAALFAEAGAKQARDPAGAAKAFQAIAGDTSLPTPMRDLATLRAVSAEFDKVPPQSVIDRLKPLTVAGNPYAPSALELTAVAWMKSGRNDKAAGSFATVARDPKAPASLRARATAMATALGQPIEPAKPRLVP